MAETHTSRVGTRGRSAGDDKTGAIASRRAAAICAILILVALARVVSTYTVFSQTTDESVHIVSGYDWWQGSWNRIDPQHPPLARILFGIPFVLQEGEPDAEDSEWPGRGNTLLWSNGQYLRDLGFARAGNLLFLAALLWIVFAWARQVAGDAVALLAVALMSALPPLLAHAGLATTDLAAATTTAGAAYALSRWLEKPTFQRSMILGLAVGFGVAAKFSFFLFFPAAAVAILLLGRLPSWRVTAGSAVVTALFAFLIVLAVYRFSLDELFRGWSVFWTHATGGHPEGAFLLGKVSIKGWWYYFPLAVFFKTPLALLALFCVGAAVTFRARPPARMHALIALAMLVCSLPVSVNIGVRHVLPLYPFMAITAAAGACWIWKTRGRIGAAVTGALLFWYALTTTLAHPDYISHFNEAAGDKPWQVLADSNFDWGQDTLRLRQFCRDANVDRLSFRLSGGANVVALGFPAPDWLDFGSQPRGWVAIGEHSYQMNAGSPLITWVRPHPYFRVGRTVRVYRIP